MPLGKLKEVDLRTVWKNEAGDFTKWLAEEENLRLLSNEIGIDLKLISDGGRSPRCQAIAF